MTACPRSSMLMNTKFGLAGEPACTPPRASNSASAGAALPRSRAARVTIPVHSRITGDGPRCPPPAPDPTGRRHWDPRLAGLVLAAVTGWGQDEDRRRAKEAGFDHHLTKPADPKDVQAVLERAGG